jgi:hypothetical protein
MGKWLSGYVTFLLDKTRASLVYLLNKMGRKTVGLLLGCPDGAASVGGGFSGELVT